MQNLTAVILAAGMGTRMKSDLVKVLHPVAGAPMLFYPLKAAKEIGCSRIIIVAGHQKDKVESAFKDENVLFAYQEEPLGSGHAVMVAECCFDDLDGDVLILCGDVPLVNSSSLEKFLTLHEKNDSVVSVLSIVLDEPFGYGRIIRGENGEFTGIVEEKDATDKQRKISEINTGIYCCKASFLFDALKNIGTDNKQGEYYLPDIISIAAGFGKKVQAVKTDDPMEVKGVNDRIDLSEVEKEMRRRINLYHMAEGVTLMDSCSTLIDAGVTIGRDTVVYPNNIIKGKSSIGSGTLVESNSVITDSNIGNNVHIKPSCVIQEASVKNNAAVGPFAHLRPQAVIGEDARVGNYVEVKKSTIGKGSKASHLTYIGDATIGDGVNVGAGTITCNYDGKNKHQTIIEDGVFIGSNTALVAPVKIGKNALIGAGSTITKDIPDNALGVTRVRQVNYNNYFRAGSKKDTDKK